MAKILIVDDAAFMRMMIKDILTKNGYGSMVVLSLEEYASLTDNIEMKLDEADRQAAMTDERLSHESVFRNVRSAVHGK